MVGRPTAVAENLVLKLMPATVPGGVPSSAVGGREGFVEVGIFLLVGEG